MIQYLIEEQSPENLYGDRVSISIWNYVVLFIGFLGISSQTHLQWVFCQNRFPPKTTSTTILICFGVGNVFASLTPIVSN